MKTATVVKGAVMSVKFLGQKHSLFIYVTLGGIQE